VTETVTITYTVTPTSIGIDAPLQGINTPVMAHRVFINNNLAQKIYFSIKNCNFVIDFNADKK
jgi:hypothetical protein